MAYKNVYTTKDKTKKRNIKIIQYNKNVPRMRIILEVPSKD